MSTLGHDIRTPLGRLGVAFLLCIGCGRADRATGPDDAEFASGPAVEHRAGHDAGWDYDDRREGRRIEVCHDVRGRGVLLDLPPAALPAHLAHGDHVARFAVDAREPDAGDGIHFARIGDALAAARAVRSSRNELVSAACRITIAVAPGTYLGTTAPTTDPTLEQFPLVIDMPDVTLRGAFRMQTDARGRATGTGEGPESTTLRATPALVTVAQYSPPIIAINGHPGGAAGDGAVIRGFAFESGRDAAASTVGGIGVLSLRVQRVEIAGNRFGGGFSEPIDLRASRATIVRNHLSGSAGTCGLCLAGPGDYLASGNRLIGGGIPGILIVPALLLPVPAAVEQFTLPEAATVRAHLHNNEVRDHLRKPVGVGIRVGAIGVGAPNVVGTAEVTATDNHLENNTFGMIVEAAFPALNTARRGDVALRLSRNSFVASCQSDLLVSLSRHTTGLGLANAPYLLNSTFSVELGGDLSWDDAWYSHPAGFGNTLVVDGTTVENGARTAYDANKTCVP